MSAVDKRPSGGKPLPYADLRENTDGRQAQIRRCSRASMCIQLWIRSHRPAIPMGKFKNDWLSYARVGNTACQSTAGIHCEGVCSRPQHHPLEVVITVQVHGLTARREILTENASQIAVFLSKSRYPESGNFKLDHDTKKSVSPVDELRHGQCVGISHTRRSVHLAEICRERSRMSWHSNLPTPTIPPPLVCRPPHEKYQRLLWAHPSAFENRWR